MLDSILKRFRKSEKPKTAKELKQEEITPVMEKIKEYILQKAPRTLGPAVITQIRLLGPDLYFSTTNGNICTYNIEQSKTVDDSFFGYPILNFWINEGIVAVAGQSDFHIYHFPSIDHIVSEKLEISSICEGIFTGGKDGTIRHWEGNSNKIVFTSQNPIGDLKILGNSLFFISIDLFIFSLSDQSTQTIPEKGILSFDVCEKFLCVGSLDGILVYLYPELTLQQKIKSKFPIHALDISECCCFLAAGFDDSTIRVYDLVKKRREIVLRGHSLAILFIQISNNNRQIVSCSKDLYIKIWSFPEFPDENLIFSDSAVSKVILNEHWIYFCNANHEVSAYHEEKLSNLFVTQGTGKSMAIKNDLLFVGDDLGYVYLFNLSSQKLEHEMEAHKGSVRGLLIHKDLLISAGADSSIYIWSRNESHTFEKIALQGHQQGIWCLALSGENLISSSSDNTIRVWSLTNYSEIGKIKASACSMCVNETLITGDLTGSVKIWNLYDLCFESTFKVHQDAVISVSSYKNFVLSASLDGDIVVIDLVYRNVIGKIDMKFPILTCAVSELQIVTGFEDKISIRNNPLFSTEIQLLGPQDLQQNFFWYMNEIYYSRSPKHNPTLDTFTILPFFFNSLHLFTMLNLPEYLKPSLSCCSPFLAVTHSPLCLSMYFDLVGLEKMICRFLIIEGANNPHIFHVLEIHIVEMNIQGISELPELYEAAYMPVFRSYLPKTAALDCDLPRRTAANYQRIQVEDFFPPEEITVGGALMFKENYIGIQMIIGSFQSIEYIHSLIKCPNPEVLRSEFVQDMIKYKWEICWYPMVIQTGLYFFYMIMFAIYIQFKNFDKYIFINLLFLLNCLLMAYETFQMIVFKSYFESIWNYVDWLRSFLLVLYYVCELFGFELSFFTQEQNLLLLTVISWMRGISYFRIFQKTRYLIRLLQESISAILGYLVFFSYLVVASTLFGYIINIDNPRSMIFYILETYNIILGTLPPNAVDYSILPFVCMTASLLLLNIIVINLMISLIGDSFEKVMSDSLSADTQELLEMIFEVENMIFTRRQNNQKLYLQCANWYFNDELASWEGKIRSMRMNLEKGHVEQTTQSKELEKSLDKNAKKIMGMNAKLDKIKKLIN